MPENLRALLVLLTVVWVLSSMLRPSLASQMPAGAYAQRRNLFAAILVSAFLAPSIWIYAGLVLLIVLATRQSDHVPSRFACLLFVIPAAGAFIPGFGLVNILFQLDHARLLSLLLLSPAWFNIVRREVRHSMGWPERLLMTLVAYEAVLHFLRAESVTSALRSMFYLFTDVYLPAFIFSRMVSTPKQIRDVLACMCWMGALLGGVGILETSRHWLLYAGLLQQWGLAVGVGNYLDRSGWIRASASAGHPIVLGYILAVAFCCWLALQKEVRGRATRLLMPTLLLGGLAATFSRGPWVAALAGAVTFWAGGSRTRLRLVGLMATAAVCAVLVVGKVPDLLPSAFKDISRSSVDYRESLFTNSVQVFWMHPWLGSTEFLDRLASMGMVQGEGIVDLVNSYVQIALEFGGIGLLLFCGIFVMLLKDLWRVHALLPRSVSSVGATVLPASTRIAVLQYQLRAILSVLVATCVTLATTSSVLVIPWIYWMMAGLAMAYLGVAAQEISTGLGSDSPKPSPAWNASPSDATARRTVAASSPASITLSP